MGVFHEKEYIETIKHDRIGLKVREVPSYLLQYRRFHNEIATSSNNGTHDLINR